jgi:copper chaperone CopZ
MTKITLPIKKMHCSSCAIRIDGDLEELPGIKSSQTDFHKAQATIDYDESVTSLDTIKKTIAAAGYEAGE